MTETEKAIIDFCGHHADWWPSTTQVQEMLALAQPAQEPVVWMMPDGQIVNKWALQFYGGQVGKPLYTTPPQRTWVSLTDEEVGDLSDFAYTNDEEFVRNVEKYLKEKNNG